MPGCHQLLRLKARIFLNKENKENKEKGMGNFLLFSFVF